MANFITTTIILFTDTYKLISYLHVPKLTRKFSGSVGVELQDDFKSEKSQEEPLSNRHLHGYEHRVDHNGKVKKVSEEPKIQYHCINWRFWSLLK